MCMELEKKMKEILLIEMPQNCGECRLRYFKQGDYCCATRNLVDPTEKDENCPLRPLPQRAVDNIAPFDKSLVDPSLCEGWNRCLEEILGETE